MGNTVSCCFRANPGDRQEEEQRLQNEGIEREVASGQAADSVEKGILPYQKEVAAGLVPEVLADTTKSVACVGEVTGNGDALREPPASAAVTNLHANAPSAVDNSISLHQKEVAAPLVFWIPPLLRKLQSQEMSPLIESEAAATMLQSQAAASQAPEKLNVDVPLAKLCTKAVFLEKPETLGYSVNVEAQNVSAEMAETTLPMTLVREEVFNATLPVDHLIEEASSKMVNTSLTESVQALKDVNLREELSNGDNRNGTLPSVPAEKAVRAEIRLSQEDPTTIAPAAKLEDRLVQNPSAEGMVSKAPEVSEIDSHLDRCGHQPLLDSSKALDGEQDASLRSSEDERLLTSAMLGTGFPQHPDSGLHLNSVPTDASARGSAAASTAQDMVFGLSTKSKSVPLPKLLAELAKLQKVVVSSNGSTHRGLAANLQDERPGSAGRWSPVSDGSEAWFTCDEDLYYSEEEIEEELASQNVMEMTELDRCSLEPPVAILIHSEKEWKGLTAESVIITKGYAVLSQSFGFFRRVREDDYCALRASLYQTLMSSGQLPDWLQRESFLLIPEKLESRYGLIEGWSFPDVCKQTSGTKNDVDLMKHYLSLLQKWWRAAAASPGLEGRRRVCDRLFQGGEDEFGVMEALKLLMLTCAVELHDAMERGRDAPIFCWLLFSRYTSPCPRTFLANHLSQVGFGGGMGQVEMCLLGYTLHHTIKVYRLHMADMKDLIVTHYPDEHSRDWPSVCLVTEDGRHYDVAVGDPV